MAEDKPFDSSCQRTGWSPRHIFRLSIWMAAWPLIVISGLICVFGGLVLYATYEDYNDARRSPTWPTALGVVKISEPMWEHSDEDNQDPNDPGQTFAEVQYEYKVSGKNYSNDGITADSQATDVSGHDEKGYIKSIVSQYSVGQTVTVYYDPTNPNYSLLKPGATFSSNSSWYFMAIFSGMLLACGLFLMALGLMLRRCLLSSLARSVAEPQIVRNFTHRGEAF